MTVSEFASRFYGLNEKETLAFLSKNQAWMRMAKFAVENNSIEEPILLARKEKDIVVWYAIAADAPQLRELIEQVTSFIGRSFSDFSGRSAVLDLTDPSEKALHDFAAGRVLKFSSPRDKQYDLGNAVKRLLKVRESREFRRVKLHRSTSTMLRDFDLALANQNREDARAILGQLSEDLDALNKRFLEIKFYAEMGEWGAIVADERNVGVVMMHRPIAVTEALIRAIWHTHLKRFETDRDLDTLRRYVVSKVLCPYRSLFANRGDMTHPEVLKTFMLVAASETPPRTSIIAELCDLVRNEQDLDFMHHWSSLMPDDAPESIIDTKLAIRNAFEEANIEKAIQLADKVEPGADKLRARLEIYARTLASSHAADVVNAIEEVDPHEFQKLQDEHHYKDVLDTLTEQFGCEGTIPTSPPLNWHDWLNSICFNRDWSPAKARNTAEEGLSCWSLDSLKEDPEEFVRRLDVALSANDSCERLYQGVPNLIRALQRDPSFPNRELTLVYAAVLVGLSTYLSRRTVDDVLAATSMFSALLSVGLTSKHFGEAFEAVAMLIDDALSDMTHGVCLDLVDVLLGAATPADSKASIQNWLKEFCLRSFELVKRNPQSYGDWELAKSIMKQSGNLHLADALPVMADHSKDSSLQEFSGSIAVYTLTESVGRRAVEVLKALAPHCKIQANSDKVGTQALHALADKASIFVMVTGSAKHAATEYIEQHRHGKPILRPDGKGVSSIVRAISAHLDANRS